MKILMVGWYKPQLGGGSLVIQELANRLKNEHEVRIINMGSGDLPSLGHWRDGKIEVYQERLFWPSRFTNLQTLFQTTKRAYLLKDNIDIYHTHGAAFSGIGLVDRSKPLVLHVHGYASLEPIASGKIKPRSINFKFLRLMELKAVQRADAIIAVGSKLRNWLIEDLGVDRRKLFLIPNGVDSNQFRPLDGSDLRAKLGYSSKERILLFIKAFTKQSGIEVLLRALPQIHKSHPETRILAIGGGPLKSEIEKISEEENINSYVRFLDRIPHQEVPNYINMSDIFISPSIKLFGAEETFGISLLEAMACGKPVIATDIGGPKEILEKGKRLMANEVGILIPAADKSAISEAVSHLIENPELSEIMGRCAREFVLKNFTWERVARDTSEVYKFAREGY